MIETVVVGVFLATMSVMFYRRHKILKEVQGLFDEMKTGKEIYFARTPSLKEANFYITDNSRDYDGRMEQDAEGQYKVYLTYKKCKPTR